LACLASNDILLLNSILQKNKPQYGLRADDGEYFELFSIDLVLRNYELSLEQLEDGWVDGGNDGGIDGFYVFIDGVYLYQPSKPLTLECLLLGGVAV
jgi:hypothetical protein